ncbi:MAG: hypothetical protein R2844_20770 [Caldilineales bacterium]
MTTEQLAVSSHSSRRYFEALLEWLANRSPWLWRLLAFGLVAGMTALAIRQASINIDGVRYFWLDDDQMISMRYARNLAEGNGLVWNPGERVEGYSNFLWTLVMAGVHLLPLPDATTSLAVKLINLGLAFAVLLLAEQLLRRFLPKPGLALPAVLLTLALCGDLLYWSANGFETTLLTVIFLGVVVRLLDEEQTGQPRLFTYLLMGLLPLVRSDALHIWLGAAILAFGISGNRRKTVVYLGVSLALPVVHVLWRRWYYGDWLPNTYYLKVYGIKGLPRIGLGYVRFFVHSYAVALLLAVVGAFLAAQRRWWLLLAGVGITMGYSVMIGGDIFEFSRFFAHEVPVILVLAAVTAVQFGARWNPVGSFIVLAALVVSTLAGAGVLYPDKIYTRNGALEYSTVAGVLIDRYTAQDARVAVIAAGGVPYFGRRYSIDMLGKSDPVIAERAPTCCNDMIGHNKFDVDYSLSKHPDLFVPMLSDELNQFDWWLEYQERRYGMSYNIAVVRNETFRKEYLPNPVGIEYLLEVIPIYVRSDSPEMARYRDWQAPLVER